MRKWGMLLFAVSLLTYDSDTDRTTEPGRGLSVRLDNGTVCFHNAGPDSVYILKPLDGSVNCMHMPHYHFTVRERNGQPVQFRPSCAHSGLWADTRWPQDYLVEIKPGATYTVGIWFEGYYKLPYYGRYTVSFEYIYQPTKEDFDPPPQAWRGTLAAPETVVSFSRSIWP